MYLIIVDGFKINDRTRKYNLCAKEYYDNVIKKFPEIKDLKTEDIEGLLVYSINTNQAHEKVFEVECKSFMINESRIKIDYGKLTEIDVKSETIKRNLYGLLKRKGLLTKDDYQWPFIAIVDINEFYKLQGLANPKIKSKIDEINDLKNKKEWFNIINYFGDIYKLEELECWNNIQYLNEIIFALSKLLEPGSKVDANEKSELEKIFDKAINKSLSVEPNNQTIKSILAYHYYLVYSKEKKNDKKYYDKANELYIWLMQHSSDSFKEKYRYWKLQQINFEIVKWGLRESWIIRVNEILAGFQNLISEYRELEEHVQKRRKKEYVGVLYAYCVFSLENSLQVWKSYVDNLIFNEPVKKYILSEDKLKMIEDVENYLKEIIQIQRFDDEKTKINLQLKPNYLNVLYRQAQIEQVKGIINTIKLFSKEECDNYFIKSNKYIEKLFKIAYEYKEKQKFLFPDFARVTEAINDFFLNRQDSYKKIRNAKPYLLYQQAVICVLQNDKDMALEILKQIPMRDNCFNKAKKLREKILDGNK